MKNRESYQTKNIANNVSLFLSILVGIIFFLGGIYLFNNVSKNYENCTKQASGIVVDVIDKSNIKVAFDVDGQSYEEKYEIENSKLSFSAGDTVEIYFQPNIPTNFYINGEVTRPSTSYIYMAIVVVVIGLSVIGYKLSYNSKKKNQYPDETVGPFKEVNFYKYPEDHKNDKK